MISYFKKKIKRQRFVYNLVLKILKVYKNGFYRIKMMLFGYKILSELHNIFEKNHIKYFLDFGTLLGLYRDGALIKDDLDLDISFLISETNPSLISKILLNSKYIKIKENIFRRTVVSQQFVKKGIKIDLHYYFRDGYSLKTYLFYKLDYEESRLNDFMNVTEKSIFMPLEFSSLKWKKNSFAIPSKTSKHLSTIYGLDWRKRIKKNKYKYWESPNSIQLVELGKVDKYEK